MTWKSENKAPPWEECDLLLCVAVLSGLKWGFWIPNIISLRLLLVWVRVKNPAFFFFFQLPPVCDIPDTSPSAAVWSPWLESSCATWQHGGGSAGGPRPITLTGRWAVHSDKAKQDKTKLVEKKTFLCHYEKKSSLLNESQMYWIKSDTGLKKAQ